MSLWRRTLRSCGGRGARRVEPEQTMAQILLDLAAPTHQPQTCFDIGWDHARHGLPPPPEHCRHGNALLRGCREGLACFGSLTRGA